MSTRDVKRSKNSRERTHQTTAPDKQCTYGRKKDTDDEESRKNGLGSEDRLPCFETLLLERSVYETNYDHSTLFLLRKCNKRLTGRPSPASLLLFPIPVRIRAIILSLSLLSPEQRHHKTTAVYAGVGES